MDARVPANDEPGFVEVIQEQLKDVPLGTKAHTGVPRRVDETLRAPRADDRHRERVLKVRDVPQRLDG